MKASVTSDHVSMHTPGPWTVEDPMSFELAIVEEGKTPAEWGFVACLPFKDQDDPNDNDFPSEVVRANAHLIAAAPDMYGICKEILYWVHGKRPGRCVTDDLTRRLVAAIGKAEGNT